MSLELLKDLKGLVFVPHPSASMSTSQQSVSSYGLGRVGIPQGLLPRKASRGPYMNTRDRQWDEKAVHLRMVVAVMEATVALPRG